MDKPTPQDIGPVTDARAETILWQIERERIKMQAEWYWIGYIRELLWDRAVRVEHEKESK